MFERHTQCFIDRTSKHVLSTVFEFRDHTLLPVENPYLALSEQCWLERTRLLSSPLSQNLHLLLQSQPRLCCCRATCCISAMGLTNKCSMLGRLPVVLCKSTTVGLQVTQEDQTCICHLDKQQARAAADMSGIVQATCNLRACCKAASGSHSHGCIVDHDIQLCYATAAASTRHAASHLQARPVVPDNTFYVHLYGST